MGWLTKHKAFQPFMSDIVSLSMYGFGSIESLLNLKVWELQALKTTMKDPDIKDAFKVVKLHSMN